MDKEVKEVMKLYKMTGLIIVILFVLGITYAIFTSLKTAEQPKPVEELVEEIPEPTIEENITEQNITINQTINITQNTTENITANITENITQNTTENITLNVTNTQQTTAIIGLAWENITITFPDSLKRFNKGQSTFHYITITEGDGTPLTNSEQFDLKFLVDDHMGRQSQVVPTFESQKWLVKLVLTNPGYYTMIVKITCADKTGHCKRFYGDGSTEKTFDFEVV